MQFLINEGSFNLPDGLQDHSMNMLLQGTSTLGLTLIISRAALEPGEALGGFIDRQLQSLTQQVSHLQVPERHLHQDPPNQELAAAELALEFVQNGQPVYQRQRVWLLADKVRGAGAVWFQRCRDYRDAEKAMAADLCQFHAPVLMCLQGRGFRPALLCYGSPKPTAFVVPLRLFCRLSFP
jgi:hypothetical protein